jgi:HD domain-containing protein
MEKLTIEKAREYALEKFKEKLPELYYKWNVLHSEGIIKILEMIADDSNIDKERLFALAWIHDIGKIISEEDHAEKSVEILKKDFELTDIDVDCILNHGSSSKPETEQGKLFRYSDGLSLFFPEIINFRFYGEAKEGKTFEEVKEILKKSYEKYKKNYSDSEEIVKILDEMYHKSLEY